MLAACGSIRRTMTKHSSRILLLLIMSSAFLACTKTSSSVSLSSGRVVEISTDDGGIAVSTNEAATVATITLKTHTVVVAPEGVSLDGDPVAELAPEESSVSVRAVGGSVVIMAGPREVFRSDAE